MSYRIRLIGLANGEPSPFDNQYVVQYDPHFIPPGGKYDGGKLLTTKDPKKAKQFNNAMEAVSYFRQSHGLRPDGKPNRPLTAYTVEILP